MPGTNSFTLFLLKLIEHSGPSQLSGSVCTYHPSAPGSNPEHNFYAFFDLFRWSWYFICHWNVKRMKTHKTIREWSIFKKELKPNIFSMPTLKSCGYIVWLITCCLPNRRCVLVQNICGSNVIGPNANWKVVEVYWSL